jgi:deoxyribodipyrimidine photo-lyase
VRLEVVDGCGLLPLRTGDEVFARAYDFRRFLQRVLPAHLGDAPARDPLRGYDLGAAPLPRGVAARWPPASRALLAATPEALAALPIDHGTRTVAARGGAVAAHAALRRFLAARLPRYADERSDPDADCASGLSPWLHFGHLSVHEVFAGLAKRERWTCSRLRRTGDGRRGWFGMGVNAEAFLDELVTWRELGFNHAWQRDDHERFGAVPQWAKATLAAHARDARAHTYSLGELAAARTHDPLWNAAQTQLRESGVLPNYLRMLWGKKVLEWTRTPAQAYAILVELNNRYALDGRDPNSYTGISWVFGRYDRPWAPERDVYGTVRYMSSANTMRKLRLKRWLAQWSR